MKRSASTITGENPNWDWRKIPEATQEMIDRCGGIENFTAHERDMIRQLEVYSMLVRRPRLGRLGMSHRHQLLKAWEREGLTFLPLIDEARAEVVVKEGHWGPKIAAHHPGEWHGMTLDSAYEYDSLASAFSMVVQHDWARALARAENSQGGEFKLPYNNLAFEFSISDCPMILHFAEKRKVQGFEDHDVASLYGRIAEQGWMMLGIYIGGVNQGLTVVGDTASCGPSSPLMTLLMSEVHAVLLALDAEVATTEIVRAPEKLNANRERSGKRPIPDYHLIDISHRVRHAPPAPELLDPDREIIHRRLHFVRGHWRHYPLHRSWIKSHMRGDPDLGFIDKDYRL